MKNPHGLEPTQFMRRNDSRYSIDCYPDYGPTFGGDICIRDQCNEGNSCYIENNGTHVYPTKLFYCDPGHSEQKGKIENNHEYIRRFIPKGNSFNEFTQDDINLMINHINSVKRDSLEGDNPYTLMKNFLPKKIIELFDIKEFIELNHLQEVTSPVIFQRGDIPHPQGLVSNEIFGITTKSRKETFAYIDLHGYFLHPHIYKSIKRSFSFLALDGCLNFLRAFASICLILSRVTLNCLPTSSSV